MSALDQRHQSRSWTLPEPSRSLAQAATLAVHQPSGRCATTRLVSIWKSAPILSATLWLRNTAGLIGSLTGLCALAFVSKGLSRRSSRLRRAPNPDNAARRLVVAL